MTDLRATICPDGFSVGDVRDPKYARLRDKLYLLEVVGDGPYGLEFRISEEVDPADVDPSAGVVELTEGNA